MNGEDSSQFFDRFLVIIHAKVAVTIVQTAVAPTASNHEKSGRLLAPAIASGGLSRAEGGDEAVRQFTGGRFEGSGHGIEDFGTGQEISLDGVVCSETMPCVIQAITPGERVGRAASRDDGELTALAEGILAK